MVAELRFYQMTTFSRGILDRSVWKGKWIDFNKDPLQKAAMLVQISAKRSIRKARPLKSGKLSTQASQMIKGSANRSNKFQGVYRPPKSRAPGHPLRRIFSVISNQTTSALIGPVGFGAATPVPAIHEFGITKTVMFPQKKFTRQKGSMNTKRTVTFKRVIAKYPKRAFMKPALETNRSKYPKLWANALKQVHTGV